MLKLGSHQKSWIGLVFIAFAFTLTGCKQDPAVVKAKFFERGQQYLQEGKSREAVIEFRNAVKVDPNFAEGYYELGLAQLQLKRWGQAYQAFNKAIELDPSVTSVRLELAELLLTQKKPVEARSELEAVFSVEPENPRAQTLLAMSYVVEKDFLRAIEEFEKALQRKPENTFLWSALGLARIGAKQFDRAEKDIRRAIELAPQSPEAYRNLANLFRLTGRTSEVDLLFQQALQTIPHSLVLYFAWADFLFIEGRLEEVEDLFAGLKEHAGNFPGVELQVADFWLYRNEVERAAMEYEAALEVKQTLLAQKKLIAAYITLGRWDEAGRMNQEILQGNPKDLEGRSYRAALRHLRGASAEAAEELRAVLRQEPQSSFANYYLGLALMALDRLAEAELAFQECIRSNEKFVHAYQKLAELRLQRQDGEVALEYARKVTQLIPHRPEGYVLLGRAYLLQGMAQQAEQVLKEVRKLVPESAVVQELLGSAYISQGKMQAGLRAYRQALERSNDPVGSLSRQVALLVEQRRRAQALQRVLSAIADDPQVGYYEILARVHLQQGDLRAAEGACRKALRLDSSRWVAHFYLGEIYSQLDQVEKALAQFDQVISRQPEQIPPYIFAGDLHLRQGQFEQARTYYEAAIMHLPQSVLAQHGLARLWAERGDRLEEALAMVQELQQNFPDNPHLSDTLAWIYYQKGLYRPAVSLLKRCLEQQSQNALFHFHLGMTYWKLGEAELSHQALERAIQMGLNSPPREATARQVLRRLPTV